MIIEAELFRQNTVLLYTIIGILSLVIGSLLNVIIYRLPRMMQAEQLAECQTLLNLELNPEHHGSMVANNRQEPRSQSPSSALNLFFPRSFCPACNRTVKAIHNIPLISFFCCAGVVIGANIPFPGAIH